MAQVKQKPVNLTQDALVQALMPDPSAAPPNAIVLSGFLGKSTHPDKWRLYLTAALDRYVEIPEDKILHAVQLGDHGTLLWIPKDMTLQLHQAQPEHIQAEFLDGAITANHVGVPAINPFFVGGAVRLISITPSGHVYCHTPLGTSCGGGTQQ
ncbi:hypothetical protein Rhe02_72970 [Rhizocola hellebori]|uniref:Uncharacterized protein n=1 Tax=Rhizocola hellebori TaxID=1392758 RepID=A0A8J3QGE8_9ACTN|nr:hypothetical protein [Rhizocola hellebori]GIH09230.1 hypothetical protein Rhe02_72970 [Rhizocola hellebori]